MKNWKRLAVLPTTSILETVGIIDTAGYQIALVVDEEDILLGTVSDGDIRRCILNCISVESPIELIMNKKPQTASAAESIDSIVQVMKEKDLRRIPVVDELGRMIKVAILEDLMGTRANRVEKENWVVLMAGGLGSRLGSLTKNCPKPLLPIGNKPLLETILNNFISYGYRKFFISVSYKADMIKSHFGDGSKWGIEIQYLCEDKLLGTAGALSLLPQKPNKPVFVMNGDLLTNINFDDLMESHQKQESKATMCIREFDFEVPYGVVRTEKGLIKGIDEKPSQHFLVNAGVYVLEPEVIDLIEPDIRIDMTSLFRKLLEKNEKAAVFPIKGYWFDIGKSDDFRNANSEYYRFFSKSSNKNA